MFGLSLTKIVLLIVVVAAVIFGTRLIRTLGRPKASDADQEPAPRRPGEAATFEACPRCGAYVDPARHRCGADADKPAG